VIDHPIKAPGAKTLGELRTSGWESLPVKEELRRNAARRIAAGLPLIEGIVGYEATVLPQLERALLAGHDVIFLGERGQAKSRMIRALAGLLDDWLPVVEGSEINDDPYAPSSRFGRDLVAEMGDATPIAWVGRAARYGEKLATPDTSIADLIGEVDPIKVAEGRYLADETTIHYGLVPRSNRGIFAINELPDLAERIQVSLLDVLEERDVQIRGYKMRLPLDVFLLASANPEDYTNRGRIITPLKDRFGAQIRTHYPLDLETEIEVILQEVHRPVLPGVRVVIPAFMTEIVGRLSQLARESGRVSQRSGVSVRVGIANSETLAAAAVRRALARGESDAVPRISDLEALTASTLGKVEIEGFDRSGAGEDSDVVERLMRQATLATFRQHCPKENLGAIVGAFEDGLVAEVGAEVAADQYLKLVDECPPLRAPARAVAGGSESESAAMVASAVELVLEGLHLSKRLNKDSFGGLTSYRAK
jgi:magnesium chelatase subunit I